jgi:anti-sigma regulatory factor (Ser/Thr protein kinase)
VLWEWKLNTFADDAEVLASELLTNAVKASWSPDGVGLLSLRLLASQSQLIIEVWDQNPDDPRPQRAELDDEHGRGFMVIDALSSRWGYRRFSANLKFVWCELVVESR